MISELSTDFVTLGGAESVANCLRVAWTQGKQREFGHTQAFCDSRAPNTVSLRLMTSPPMADPRAGGTTCCFPGPSRHSRRQLPRHGASFRGGTALHKLHLESAYRYSEDLDYVRTSASGIGPLTRTTELLDGLDG